MTALPQRVDLPTRRVKLAGFITGCLVFVAAGAWMLRQGVSA